MTRKTVMHRETEVFVVEERLAPRKEAIKRRVKLERCIAAGINLGAMILTGGALVKIGLMVFAVIDSRTGGLGGEVLVFPALAMMFLWGREIGLRQKLLRTMEESIEQKAQERADRKLQYIIGRYGDANGERRKPYYREQLIQEAKAALSWEVFSLAFMELCKENAPVTPTKASEA